MNALKRWPLLFGLLALLSLPGAAFAEDVDGESVAPADDEPVEEPAAEEGDAEDELTDLIMIIVGVAIGELLIPDVRYEFSTDPYADGWVLSWPFVFTLAEVGFGAEPEDSFRLEWALMVHVFAEPHYEVTEGNFRGAFGGRLSLAQTSWIPYDLGIYGEGGGVTGQDGDGALVGGGIFLSEEGLASVLLMVRATLLDAGPRYDVCVNFELPIPLNLLF
ncbi:MAG: hypothetical protein CO108_18380 [Deltaproteobacteria bacterium CG_4_9_14_3_um_filter_63_12]|nr:MAG: hypothetical protein COW42_10835 [Deltaproteobacteria bacterium CG17_big_fil_post_rev_8_21_14_2_50_63_7]PJB38813.1 MAG: hypothetical protein CO108_18380 [Deltaproteobacteria bacterium CG_4_9_14_3_um_filter_63_12]